MSKLDTLAFHEGNILKDKVGLVIGIANENSLAYGCAKHFRDAGAKLAITYLNAKADPYVRPLAEQLHSPLILPCDVAIPGQLEAVFEEVKKKWGRLDFLLHSIAFAPKDDLQGRIVDCSSQGFTTAMDISVHSFVRCAKLAEPLMEKGGSLLTLTYYGAEKVVENYNLMGPVKAALQSTTAYMAAELGPKGIRVNCLSPGPVQTRAASGIGHFTDLLNKAVKRSPGRQGVCIEDVGALASFLVSDYAKCMTGNVEYIDAGYHCLG